MTSTKTFQFQENFKIMSFQINEAGRLRWNALGDILQEVAWQHADSAEFGQGLFEKGLMWVLSRFHINAHQMPAWGDDIIVKTAGRGIDRLFALREFEVTDLKGNILVTAMSAWLLLDINSKRPQKPMQVLPGQLFQPEADPELLPKKITIPGQTEKGIHFNVMPSDLDMNKHVNNVTYLRWIEDQCILLDIPFAELQINYLSEACLGEHVELDQARAGNGEFFISGNVEKRLVFTAKVNS
jgi:medium-chain acyl-[acyl-carrier-protein] hydrolase